MTKTKTYVLAGILLTWMLVGVAVAQTNVGRISGTVTDTSGAVIPEATVVAKDTKTGLEQRALTDDVGFYVFPSLAAGTYHVRVEMPSFQTSEQQGVVLDAASRRNIDFKLEVGAVAESVAVTASEEQVQTTSGNVGRVINEQQVSQIALNGRNYMQLLQTVPGVVSRTLDQFNLALAINQHRVNGIRTSSAYFMVDGAENHDNGANDNALVNPNVDAIAEVKIDTSGYSAEFGGRAGAMVNVVTRSGSREFHGTLFEFVRNDTLDARSFFARQVEPLRFNNFGWTLGGPIFIPRRWNTDRTKLFFFYGEEWKYIRQGETRLNVVPTSEERSGDFRNSSLPAPVDPLTGQPFPDRIVPPSRWSKNGPLLLKPYPLPNFSGPGGQNYLATGVNKTDFRQELLRLDYYFSPTTQLAYRLINDKWDIVFPFRNNNLGIVPNPRPRPGYVTSVNLQHAFSPTMLNFFSLSVGKNSIHGRPANQILKRSVLGLTFPKIYPANRSGVGPAVNVAGFASYTSGDRIRNVNPTVQWRDDFTKIIGSHMLKFGLQITHARKNENTNVRDEGVATFSPSARSSTGNVIANVLLGNFQNYTEAERDQDWWARYNQFEFYAQESWKVTRRLSLEFGLRYNLIPPFYNALGNSSTFVPRLFDPAKAPQVDSRDGSIVPGTGDPLSGIAFFGEWFPASARGRLPQFEDPSLARLFVGLPRGGSKTNKNDWGPRFGIAYDVFGTGKTALRAGLGIFYDRLGSNAVSGQAQNPPFAATANVFDGNIDNPAGGTERNFPSNLTAWPQRLPTPSVMSYNVGIQQEIAGNIIVDVSYVGNVARHFPFFRNLNQLPAGTRLNPPNSTINVNALRFYRGYGNISLRDHSDNSNYNSLQVSLSRRIRSGLAFGSAYTFSRTLDMVGGGTPQDSYNPKADYGLSEIHRKHILNFNYVYNLLFFKGHPSAFVRAMLGGWEVSGNTSFQGGAPRSIIVPVDIARIGASASRATVIANPNLPRGERTLTRWFNTGAFLPPDRMVQGQFGNSGRNILIGPGFQVWDMSLLKSFDVSERARLQFRAEAFNIFNHPNFTDVNTTVRFDSAGRPTGGFGSVSNAGPGRVLSFGLKLLF